MAVNASLVARSPGTTTVRGCLRARRSRSAGSRLGLGGSGRRACSTWPTGPDPRQRLDVHADGHRQRRRGGGQGAGLVVIPGGYWRALGADYSYVAASFADARAVVVVPEYELRPAVIERIALQMTEALARCGLHVADYGGDPHRITLGHLAGGHPYMLSCCDWKLVGRDRLGAWCARRCRCQGCTSWSPLRKLPFLAGDLQPSAASARRLSPACFAPPLAPGALGRGQTRARSTGARTA